MNSIFDVLESITTTTLAPSADAVQARLKHAIDNLEKKLIKAEKRNYLTRVEQVEDIKNASFPKDGLQERTENFGLFYVNGDKILLMSLSAILSRWRLSLQC